MAKSGQLQLASATPSASSKVAPDLQQVACADADLASLDSLLDDAADVLCQLAAARTRVLSRHYPTG